jgi:hypothetical protein
MRTLFASLLLVLAALVAPAAAQPCVTGTPCVIAPSASLSVAWDLPEVAADQSNRPQGIRLKALRDTPTGVEVKTWDFGLVTTAALPATTFPDGLFHLTATAYNTVGESARSNVIGPFVRGAVPAAPTLKSAAPVTP